MQIIQTRFGLRLSQHGIVISELRTSPGPTHSVFDVLAALLVLLRPAGRLGMLGFAGGGMMAPLQALGMQTPISAVDLDRESYALFRAHCPDWVTGVRWHCADAAEWLGRQKPGFDLLLDDLSVPRDGDVIKPDISWSRLPDLMAQRLKPEGVAIFNLVSAPAAGWSAGMKRVAAPFRHACVVHLDEYENRILIAGNKLPAVRSLGRSLRVLLRRLQSRQAERIRMQHL